LVSAWHTTGRKSGRVRRLTLTHAVRNQASPTRWRAATPRQLTRVPQTHFCGSALARAGSQGEQAKPGGERRGRATRASPPAARAWKSTAYLLAVLRGSRLGARPPRHFPGARFVGALLERAAGAPHPGCVGRGCCSLRSRCTGRQPLSPCIAPCHALPAGMLLLIGREQRISPPSLPRSVATETRDRGARCCRTARACSRLVRSFHGARAPRTPRAPSS